MALVFIYGIIVILALLFFESHKGRHHENGSYDQSNHSKPKQVLDSALSFMLNALLKIDTLIQISTEKGQLKEDPADMH